MKFKEIVNLQRGSLYHKTDASGGAVSTYLVIHNNTDKEKVNVLAADEYFDAFAYIERDYTTLQYEDFKLGPPNSTGQHMADTLSKLRRIQGDAENFANMLKGG